MIITIISLIGTLLPTLLTSLGVATPSIDKLITASAAAIGQIVLGLQTKTPVNATLAALDAALAALEADTSIDPIVLADIGEGVRDLRAAISAYQASQITTDPVTLTPLPLL